MSLPAFLLAFTEPGSNVTPDEFNDWYDNEHVPLRIAVPAFQSWTRWKAIDDKKPTWAATYDLASYDGFLQPPYSTLAETRSERESRILTGVETVERRTYEAYAGNSKFPSPISGKEAQVLEIVSIDIKPEMEEEFQRWYDEDHVPAISTRPGWVRSRRFVLKEWTRGGVEGVKDQTGVPRWLAVHEYTDLEWQKDPKARERVENEWTLRVRKEIMTRREIRFVALHRKWERE
ncbi:hypothetical protein BDY19DRAFT_912290 [Irpex rosettiformis]|uniref:Uncharacterized protein n=1 Tax=Irpex rosettiformis TaxID=378272 RepID=A0ACB8UJP4_9APHY|nr:hypothetical protein BDY19DRAFT_912290 [Irpex rosettiformis]